MVLVAHRFISIAVKFYSIRFSAYLTKEKNNFGQMALPEHMSYPIADRIYKLSLIIINLFSI